MAARGPARECDIVCVSRTNDSSWVCFIGCKESTYMYGLQEIHTSEVVVDVKERRSQAPCVDA